MANNEFGIATTDKGILQMDNVRIIHRNFSGRKTMYNKPGDRNFSVLIPDLELGEQLKADGWNIKTSKPRDPDDTVFMYLPVKVNFNGRGPLVILATPDGNQVRLDESTVNILDEVYILNVKLDIRPYHWEVNGSSGVTGYLSEIWLLREQSRFEDIGLETPGSDELPF